MVWSDAPAYFLIVFIFFFLASIFASVLDFTEENGDNDVYV